MINRASCGLAKLLVWVALTSSPLLLCHCTMEERRDIDRVTFIVRDFEPVPDDSPDTRTSIVNGNSFVWSDKDTVGIYPDSGSQVYFAMTSGAGANSAYLTAAVGLSNPRQHTIVIIRS